MVNIPDNSFIKIHRKLINWEWYQDSNMVHLFIHLLVMATYKNTSYRGIELKRGQLLTGRLKLHEQTKISEQTIRTCLNRLKSTNELTIKSTKHYCIITICKYDSYQIIKKPTNQQINHLTNQQLTNNQPTTNHIQEDKEYKEVNNLIRKNSEKIEIIENTSNEGIEPKEDLFSQYEIWAENIKSKQDSKFEQMCMTGRVDMLPCLVDEYVSLLAQYPNKKPNTIARFRSALLQHIKDNYKKQTGTKNKNMPYL
jgi:hypothetical protein